MNKPNAFDEVSASQNRETPTLGGHYASIKKVIETKTKDGRDQIVVCFDFAFPDKQDGFFMKAYQEDDRADKKWPFTGKKWIGVNDYKDKDKVSKAFTSFCSAVEKSNPEFSIQWGNDWGNQFTGKKVGVVFGLEESEYNGNTYMRAVPKWFSDINKVESASIPEPKYLKRESVPEGFEKVEENIDIPF